jgi:hypothetical protein
LLELKAQLKKFCFLLNIEMGKPPLFSCHDYT